MKSRSSTWTFMGALLAICLGHSAAQATVTPYVVSPSGFSDYALISDLSRGGNTNINQSTINGDVGLINSKMNSSNNDTINGDLSYTSSDFSINKSVTVTGNTAQDVTLTSASASAALFSKSIANMTPTQILSGDINNGTTLTAKGDLNVFSLTGNNVNGTITLSGDSNDVFYINVSGNLNISGITLNGVDAKNVYWNIIGGGNANLSGNLAGTFLAYNSSSQATSLNINNATIEGNIYGGSLNMSNVTLNGVSLTEALENEAVAPEPGTVAALALFGLLMMSSSIKRYWQRRKKLFATARQPKEALAAC